MNRAMRAVVLAACCPAVFVEAAERATPVLVADFDGTWRQGRWRFSNGAEFPGAAGRLERSQAAARRGRWGGRLAFDFTKGGKYVSAQLPLADAPSIAAVNSPQLP